MLNTELLLAYEFDPFSFPPWTLCSLSVFINAPFMTILHMFHHLASNSLFQKKDHFYQIHWATFIHNATIGMFECLIEFSLTFFLFIIISPSVQVFPHATIMADAAVMILLAVIVIQVGWVLPVKNDV